MKDGAAPLGKGSRGMFGHWQQLQAVSVGWRSVLDPIRDPSLSALLILEFSIIFFTAPLAAKGVPIAETVVNILTWAMVVIIVLLSERWGAIVSIVLALSLISANFWLRADLLPISPMTLSRIGSILGFSALTWVVAQTVFAPGRITAQRLQGTVVVYLNLAMIFASIYRVIGELNPKAFTNGVGPGNSGELGAMLYFSLVTLTTTGYGDIAPVDPFARGMANLEAVIGQFYLAITVARLVALEIADRRR
jgi:hypothetical protein